MASLDTNCLLRWFLGDVPEHQERVDALLDDLDNVVVDDVILIEAIFVMESTMSLSRSTIRSYIDTAMSYDLVINRSLWTSVLATWASHPKLSVVDVYLTAKAADAGTGPVYTFDLKMINQLNAVVVPELADE